MSQRSFKYFTIASGGHPQPLIGSFLTANAGPSPGNAPDQRISIPVNDSSMFLKGDWVYLVLPNGTNPERALVYDIPDGTHVRVNSLAAQHAGGGGAGVAEWIALSVLSSRIYFQVKPANLAELFVGTAPTMVTGTGVQMIARILNTAAGQAQADFLNTDYFGVNQEDVNNYWIDGTTNDSYLPSIGPA